MILRLKLCWLVWILLKFGWEMQLQFSIVKSVVFLLSTRGSWLEVMRNKSHFGVLWLIKSVVICLYEKVVIYLWAINWFYSNQFCLQFRFTFFLLQGSTCTIFLIESIFKVFLRDGSETSRKINWIKWDKICLDKEHGGLVSVERRNLIFIFLVSGVGGCCRNLRVCSSRFWQLNMGWGMTRRITGVVELLVGGEILIILDLEIRWGLICGLGTM
jgi:hypothetical protein